MNKRNLVAGALTLLLLAGIALLYVWNEARVNEPAAGEGQRQQARLASARDILTVDIVSDWQKSVSADQIDEALSCIDESRTISCGEFEGYSALYFAALTENREMLSREATADALHRSGQDALNLAAALGDIESLKLLLERGLSAGLIETVEEPYIGNKDPRMHPIVSATDAGRTEIVSYFLENGVSAGFRPTGDEPGLDLFSIALMGNRLDTARVLLGAGYEVDCEYRFPRGIGYKDLAEELEYEGFRTLLIGVCG